LWATRWTLPSELWAGPGGAVVNLHSFPGPPILSAKGLILGEDSFRPRPLPLPHAPLSGPWRQRGAVGNVVVSAPTKEATARTPLSTVWATIPVPVRLCSLERRLRAALCVVFCAFFASLYAEHRRRSSTPTQRSSQSGLFARIRSQPNSGSVEDGVGNIHTVIFFSLACAADCFRQDPFPRPGGVWLPAFPEV